jgi:hypothetical protein
MTAVLLLLLGLAIGWWADKARFWYEEVGSSRAKVRRSRRERNRSMGITALFLAVLVVVIIIAVQGR